ncbi:hypothetical protein D9X30_5463 [Cupriavidus sp. U2]|nr:hypothetical protein D9X30_5463 [Cupriavidus sp. U2]
MPATVQGAREERERGRENCRSCRRVLLCGRLGAGERRGCRRPVIRKKLAGDPLPGRERANGPAPDAAISGGCRRPGARAAVGRAIGTGNAAYRSRAGMARTRQRASHPDAAVACHCQTDLSAGGRAAGSSRSALGRRCRIVELRRPPASRGGYCRSVGRVSPAGPAPVPGAGGLLSPMRMPLAGTRIEFFST